MDKILLNDNIYNDEDLDIVKEQHFDENNYEFDGKGGDKISEEEEEDESDEDSELNALIYEDDDT